MDTLPQQQWHQARLTRDPRFDGIFYIGVLTTGIFCRPICPARLPREDNVRYLRSPAEAIDAGFRPCKRCRPEHAPKSIMRLPDERLDSALHHIEQGFLDNHGVADLAYLCELSERQLRRLFTQCLGATPQKVADTRRLLQAKQLLRDSNLKITDVALASGFNSIRRFNSAVKTFYHQTPREIRQGTSLSQNVDSTQITLQLPHSRHYPWASVLNFYRQRAINEFECVDESTFSRVLTMGDHAVLLQCRQPKGKHCIELMLTNATSSDITHIASKARQALDLNSNLLAIADKLKRDPALAAVFERTPVIALPGAWDAFEYLIRAIIGQQVSVKAAKTLTQRVIQVAGTRHTFGDKHYWRFPSPKVLADTDLSGLGLTTRRIATIRDIADAQAQGRIDVYCSTSIKKLQQQLLAIKGIGPWTVDYLLMRAFFQPDIWLDTDLGVIKALQRYDETLAPKLIKRRADSWSPWRSYGVLALWQSLSENS